MAFSGALTLTDLNDFITPSQACIKPVEQANAPESIREPGSASTEIRIDSAGAYYEVAETQKSRKLETAQISLNDCLACSGCITSAESVLITLQSHEEVFNFLSNNPPITSVDHRIPVLSIAPQSIASLAASISSTSSASISLRQVLRRVHAFCKRELGFTHIYDTTFARHISLLEHKQEFRERRRGAAKTKESQSGDSVLPMLASACPGWVCYAEKTHAEMLPFISRTKSPQQVMGMLVKNWLGEKWGKRPDQIYHVTVMPCYDKKLEASRQDFYSDIYSTRDVDCVITTGELELMMRERNWDLSAPVPHEEDDVDFSSLSEPYILPELLMHTGTSSGSYLHALLEEYLTDDTELTTRTIRSADYEEFIVTDKKTGEITFKGAKCYGFRNLQNVVRKVGKGAGVQIGRGAAGRLANTRKGGVIRKAGGKIGGGLGTEKEKEYDYVEVMACPGGCVNGGGQIKPPNRNTTTALGTENTSTPSQKPEVEVVDSGLVVNGPKWGDREWTRKVEEAYWHDLPTPPPSPPPSGLVKSEYSPPSSSPSPEQEGKSGTGKRSTDYLPASMSSKMLTYADELAVRVLVDLCRPRVSGVVGSWASEMDDEGEEARRKCFRTQYRAVVSDIVGLQVKW